MNCIETFCAPFVNRPEMEFRANNENPVNWVKQMELQSL
jgi:hypothetical protein